MVFCYAERLRFVAQGVFRDDFVFAFAEQQADGGRVIWVLHLGIHGGQVEAQLAEVLRLEFPGLQFDHHVATQLQVVKEQVEGRVSARRYSRLAAHIQQDLPTNEGESRAQLQQEIRDVLHQCAFDLPLLRLLTKAEEIETIRVF